MRSRSSSLSSCVRSIGKTQRAPRRGRLALSPVKSLRVQEVAGVGGQVEGVAAVGGLAAAEGGLDHIGDLPSDRTWHGAPVVQLHVRRRLPGAIVHHVGAVDGLEH
eukprot:14289362-Alexandrium_andersonii.AAC.1